MVSAHYLLFIGASPSFSTELSKLSGRFQKLKVIAPAGSKGNRGITSASISLGLHQLVDRINKDKSFTETTRFSVWSYEPISTLEFESIWSFFGRSGWIEFLPRNILNIDIASRVFIENKIGNVIQSINYISLEIYNRRKNSPFSLPLTNFNSKISNELSGRWYNNIENEELRDKIKKIAKQFHQSHKKEKSFEDNRGLIFSPAEDGACHGKPHPLGDDHKCFVAGRFRFGATLFPGFHYDVRSANSPKLNSTLFDCSGDQRNMKSESRAYINIFPNDHMLPKK
jgi:hypothetical protein